MDFEEFKKSIDLYLDGELDTSTALKFQELVDTDSRCRELLEREERFRLLVREELSKDRASDTLRARVLKNIRRDDLRQRKTYVSGWRAAAAVLLAVLIGGGIYFQYDRRDLSRLVESSVKSHRIYSVVGEPAEYPAKDERTLLVWLQKRVPFPLVLPSLSGKDVEILGGRVWPLQNRQTALTFYRKGNNRLSLFTLDRRQVRLPRWGGKEIADQTVYLRGSGGYRVAVWQYERCVFALVGELPKGEFVRVLSNVFGSKVVRPQA